MTIEQQRALVRELARRYMDIATSDAMQTKERRWRDTTSGRTPDRAPVWLNLNACRREVQSLEDLRCEDRHLREAEDRLRWSLFCHSLGDDGVLLPEWPVSAAVHFEGEHLYGVPIQKIQPADSGGAWKYDPVIREEKDLDKLRIPRWVHNEAETARRRQRAEDLLGDIIPVRVVCGMQASPTLDNTASLLIGMQELMLNLADNPAMVHRLMAFLRDFALSAMEQVEAMGLLTENNNGHKHLSDSIRRTPAGQPLKTSDLWIWTNSQNFQLVGPAQFREFLLEYQRPILERCGATSYGCCEDLTLKIDHIATIKNLRIYVNSNLTKL
ncbi:MAG: hypothetical protein NTW86_24660 [Candidatus Sumerlaeota bacterium]|nr:hypothetical protein [Candidatus Sumerlaeota bacterium]